MRLHRKKVSTVNIDPSNVRRAVRVPLMLQSPLAVLSTAKHAGDGSEQAFRRHSAVRL
mgnify:CR=1 FL=1